MWSGPVRPCITRRRVRWKGEHSSGTHFCQRTELPSSDELSNDRTRRALGAKSRNPANSLTSFQSVIA